MSALLARRAEILKLERLLGTAPGAFAFLEKIEALVIRALREQMTGALFDSDRAALQKVAAATKLTPTAIAAVIAEKALGALLCARVAALLPADKAIDISRRLSPDFLAEVCLHIDPRRVQEIIRGTPVSLVVAVSKRLEQQREFVTMARFVDALTLDAIKAVMAETDDVEALLRTAFFVENPARNSELVALLPKAKLKRLVQVSTTSAELWSTGLGLMELLTPQWRGEMGVLAAELDDAALERIARFTQQENLWDAELSTLMAMPEPARRRMLESPAFSAPPIRAAIAATAKARGVIL
jgi:hypothetical protein